MGDRIDREINEILEKLGESPDDSSEPRRPIPISSARPKSRQSGRRAPSAPLLGRVDPAVLMFSGAGVMLGGLVLSAFADFLIWVAFAGVLMFICAFLLSFARGWPQNPRSDGRPTEGVFWRDRYIQYDSRSDGSWSRIRRKFKR